MTDWLQPEFDKYRQWIDSERGTGRTWDEIADGVQGKARDEWLQGLVDYAKYPPLGSTAGIRAAAWLAIVDGKKKWEEEAARDGRLPVVVGPDAADRGDVSVPVDERSCWQMYRRHLLHESFRPESVESIKTSSFRILRRLKWGTTQPAGAVKGMVVGHVQSGKTASMAGLIAMAMDWDWNLVIVLTGTIENLRQQTHERLLKDLNHGGNIYIHAINHPSKRSANGERAQDLQFGAKSKQRCLIVSLKNSKRLENLKGWIEADPGSLAQMRILLIDDEADQASIDTSPRDREERTEINRLIVALTRVGAKCVNYVAYTATPYANFLNEAWPDSLYPKNFIIALPQPAEHFGPKQIFGVAETESEGGLGIVREVPGKDLRPSDDDGADKNGGSATIQDLHAGTTDTLPGSLQEAVCWFLCSTAAIRAFGTIKKPVSMLVHTSARQAHHENVANAILGWLRSSNIDHVSLCRSVWDTRCGDLSPTQLRSRMASYPWSEEPLEYPAFAVIERHLRELLSQITHIPMEVKADEQEPKYHRGVHVCIDNCANNGITDEGEHLRLLYPKKKQDTALAFLVIGGSTLSRGLTIENLVSTYFLRSGAQMDTLMQMGRWFGYRKGYELLPRIWMPEETCKKFVFMAGVEQELRDELAMFMDGGRDPSEYGPRVRAHPTASWLRPTAANKMKEAMGADFDFSGINKQLTIFYSRDEKKLCRNLTEAAKFLGTLGAPRDTGARAVVWGGVPFSTIETLLQGQEVHGRARFFSEIASFSEWFKKNDAQFDRWNVVVAGLKVGASTPDAAVWTLPNGAKVGKITRTRLSKASDADSVSIGVLRDPSDLLADAESEVSLGEKTSNVEVTRARGAAGLGNTPQLLLYRIDRSSTADPRDKEREKLDVPEDLLGISIWMPGEIRSSKHNFATHLTVRIPEELRRESDDVDSESIAAE